MSQILLAIKPKYIYVKPKFNIDLNSKLVIQNRGLFKYLCFSSFNKKQKQTILCRGGCQTLMYVNHFFVCYLL